MSIWHYQFLFDSHIESFAYVLTQVLFLYENIATVLIWLFGMLELHFNEKIVKYVMKLSNSGLQKPVKLSKFWIFSEMLTPAKIFNKFQCFDI